MDGTGYREIPDPKLCIGQDTSTIHVTCLGVVSITADTVASCPGASGPKQIPREIFFLLEVLRHAYTVILISICG